VKRGSDAHTDNKKQEGKMQSAHSFTSHHITKQDRKTARGTYAVVIFPIRKNNFLSFFEYWLPVLILLLLLLVLVVTAAGATAREVVVLSLEQGRLRQDLAGLQLASPLMTVSRPATSTLGFFLVLLHLQVTGDRKKRKAISDRVVQCTEWFETLLSVLICIVTYSTSRVTSDSATPLASTSTHDRQNVYLINVIGFTIYLKQQGLIAIS
jgi:hypothetical protein